MEDRRRRLVAAQNEAIRSIIHTAQTAVPGEDNSDLEDVVANANTSAALQTALGAVLACAPGNIDFDDLLVKAATNLMEVARAQRQILLGEVPDFIRRNRPQ